MSLGGGGLANFARTSVSIAVELAAVGGLGGPGLAAYNNDLRWLFENGRAGYLWGFEPPSLNRQTFNSPALTAPNAGDPVGLMLPAQAPEAITNLLLWTDSLNASPWGSFQTTILVGGDTGPTGVPNAARIIAGNNGASVYTRTHAISLDASTTVSFGVALKAGTITSGVTIQFFDKAGAVQFGKTLNLSNGTLSGSDTGGTSSVSTDGNGFYLLKFENVSSGVGGGTPELRIVFTGTGNGTNYFIASQARCNLGSTLSDYQPNAGCLGGSNRRSGGANLLLWSQMLTMTAQWTPTRATVGNSPVATYDGLMIGNSLIEDATAANTHDVRSTGSPSTNAGTNTYTVHFEVKKATRDFTLIELSNNAASSNRARAWFNINTGVVGTGNTVGSGVTYVSHAINSLGDGWYRCVLVATVDVSVTATQTFIEGTTGDSVTNYNGVNGQTSIYIARAMLHSGSTLLPYTQNMDQVGGLITNVPLYQTNTANRLAVARWPANGIYNLLLSTSDFATLWTLGGIGTPSVTVNTIANPLTGVVNGDTVTGNGGNNSNRVQQTVTVAASTTYVLSVYVKNINSITTSLQVSLPNSTTTNSQSGANWTAGEITSFTNNGTAVGSSESLGNGWYRFSVRFTTNASDGGTATVRLYPSNNDSGLGNKSVYFYGAMLNVGATALTYQDVATATDITESGQPYNYGYWFDGTSDFATTGVQAFGTASLFAAPGQAWTVFGVFRTVDSVNNLAIVAKAGATSGSRTLQLFRDAATSQVAVICRGTSGTYGDVLTTGAFAVWGLRWNGTALQLYVNRSSPVSVTVGSAVEEVQNITVGIRTESAPVGAFSGHNMVDMLDRAVSDTEMAAIVATLNAKYRPGL